MCCCCLTGNRFQHTTLLLLEHHAEPFMYKAQAKLLHLAAYIQPNLHVGFVPGDEEKALHFRTQGKGVLGNATKMYDSSKSTTRWKSI